jgi:hypothetical protein
VALAGDRVTPVSFQQIKQTGSQNAGAFCTPDLAYAVSGSAGRELVEIKAPYPSSQSAQLQSPSSPQPVTGAASVQLCGSVPPSGCGGRSRGKGKKFMSTDGGGGGGMGKGSTGGGAIPFYKP